MSNEPDYGINIASFFRGQADAYIRSDEKRNACGCLSYRAITKFIGLWNVTLLIAYIVRCILAEDVLSTHLEEKIEALKTAGGDGTLTHDYTAIFAMIEVLSFVGQTYSVFAFFRWKQQNNDYTRSQLPCSNFIQAAFNIITCGIVFAYFSHPKITEIDGTCQEVLSLWYGKASWALVCINMVCYHYTKEYESQNRGIEHEDEHQETRVRLMVDSLWSKFDENGDDVLSKPECKKFIKNILRKGDKLNNDRFDVLFDEIDTNKNGKIERDEMVNFVTALYNDRGEEEVDQENGEGEQHSAPESIQNN